MGFVHSLHLKGDSFAYRTCLYLLLFVLGIHLLDDKVYLFLPFLLLCIDWKSLRIWSTFLVAMFLVSLYTTWVYIDHDLVTRMDVGLKLFSQGLLVLLMYLLGRTLSKQVLQSERGVFYLLLFFIIGYMFSLAYSYWQPYIEEGDTLLHMVKNIFTNAPKVSDIPKPPINGSFGMMVCFPNEYKRLHVNGGYLISTIIAYYLSLMAIILPLLLFNISSLKQKKFGYMELAFLITLSLFALYLASVMGRRTVIALLLFSFVSIVLLKIVMMLKRGNIKYILLVIFLAFAFSLAFYWMFSDTPAVEKLAKVGIHDKRFGWWYGGIQAMLHYPFGGGHGVFLAHNMKMAHNTWIDIGKDFGVIPFLAFLLLSLYFLYQSLSFLLSRHTLPFLKQMVFLMTVSIYAIMMIEPVFTSDKTFIAYIFFFFGVVANLDERDRSNNASQ